MSNVIQFSINGDTNAEKVTDRVKASVSSLEKNMQGIENKFKSFGKDLFLSFAAPMVILNSAMNMISSAIEKNRQKIQEAQDFAARGESKFLDKGTVSVARENQNRQRELAERELAAIAREKETKTALEQGGTLGFGGEADAVIAEYNRRNEGILGDIKAGLMYFGLTDMSKNEEIQKIVGERAAARLADSPEGKAAAAADKQKEVAQMQADKQKELDSKPTTFKGPDGFSNVIGVGANPVMEAMSAQLEEQRKQTAILERIAAGSPSPADGWLSAPTGNPHVDGYGDQM